MTLSILCDEGNARAHESGIGRRTDTYAFFVSKLFLFILFLT